MPHHLYAYGTLQLPEIVSQIVGRPLSAQPATLLGYVRFRVADRVYPAIVEEPAGEVTGVVYRDLSPTELTRLDVYEGDLYERRQISVVVGARSLLASTYVLRPEHSHRLSSELWDLEHFRRDHLESYLACISVTSRAP
jgi:hypothetical protein